MRIARIYLTDAINYLQVRINLGAFLSHLKKQSYFFGTNNYELHALNWTLYIKKIPRSLLVRNAANSETLNFLRIQLKTFEKLLLLDVKYTVQTYTNFSY